MSKILVVDDDDGVVDALEVMLKNSGYEVETSFDGDEAFEIDEKKLPDLILLDVLLSGRDGREICRYLKSKSITRNIPVIMISAHPTTGRSIRAAGAEDFLEKPFDAPVLLAKIKSFLKTSASDLPS